MNDLDLYDQGGDLAPYTPTPSPLPASTPAGLPVDLISEHRPGTAPQHVNQGIDAAAKIFANDMPRLGVPDHLSKAAVLWYRGMAAAPVPHEPARHGYNLSGLTFPRADQPYVTAFANHMRQRGADQASVRNMLWWHGELTRRLQQQQQAPATRQSPPQGNTLDDLSDAEYAYVIRRSDADKRAGMDELRVRWANDFEPRMRVVQQYFAGLPEQERDYLESAITKGGVLAANSPDFIDRVYRQAIGPLPTGGALQAELAQLESRMRTERRAWNRDEKSQLRLRELYRLRDG